MIATALLMVVSGVAAVSAYEAHTINVKAHVENALLVDTAEMDFGTVFPEEILYKEAAIGLSSSANGSMGGGQVSGNLSSVEYKVFAEYKLEVPGTNFEYYQWLGEWLWVGNEGAVNPDTNTANLSGLGWYCVGPQPDDDYAYPVGVKPVPMASEVTGLSATLNAQDKDNMVRVMLLTPAFHNSYNADTDALVKPQWWLDLIADEMWPRLSGDGSGTDLGLDLKIQVTGINRNS